MRPALESVRVYLFPTCIPCMRNIHLTVSECSDQFQYSIWPFLRWVMCACVHVCKLVVSNAFRISTVSRRYKLPVMVAQLPIGWNLSSSSSVRKRTAY